MEAKEIREKFTQLSSGLIEAQQRLSEAGQEVKQILQEITALQRVCPHLNKMKDFISDVVEIKQATFCKDCGARL